MDESDIVYRCSSVQWYVQLYQCASESCRMMWWHVSWYNDDALLHFILMIHFYMTILSEDKLWWCMSDVQRRITCSVIVYDSPAVRYKVWSCLWHTQPRRKVAYTVQGMFILMHTICVWLYEVNELWSIFSDVNVWSINNS